MLKKYSSLFAIVLLTLFSCAGFAVTSPNKHIIIYVWDGLRPDSVTQQTTPNLYKFMRQGVQFTDQHSSYPTFTMMNAASFATGDFAGKTGFFGNTLWDNKVQGNDAWNKPIDFQQPVFTEDYKVLQDLDSDELILVQTLFHAAQQAGMTTAAVGKSGPAFLQDYKQAGIVFDEMHAYPLSFAKQLQADAYALPKLTPNAFPAGELSLATNNGNPTGAGVTVYMQDGVTADPTDASGSPYSKANEYMMQVYLNEILPKDNPQLSVIWMRNPDTTEHAYGPGTADYLAALASNDKMLGQLQAKLKTLGLLNSTDIIIVSDHAHSHVSGPVSQYPLRTVQNGNVGQLDPNGYSVSGVIRTAPLLDAAGFHAYDGEGCRYNPVLSGIKADGNNLYPTLTDKDGSACGEAGQAYTTPAYWVPQKLPRDAIIIAQNGGSEYFYIPSHNKKLVTKVTRFLQSHTQYGPVFIDDKYYQNIAGTLPMSAVNIMNPLGRSPDIIVSFNYDVQTKINGLPGIEFSDLANSRGMHGTFSPIDVHNFLAASGPDFREQYRDQLPSGNVDVAPTIAYLLQLNLPNTDGRVLREALQGNTETVYKVKAVAIQPIKRAVDLQMLDSLNQVVLQKTTYTILLQTKQLTDNQGHAYTYFDFAKAVRN